jgi:hypothetical protein
MVVPDMRASVRYADRSPHRVISAFMRVFNALSGRPQSEKLNGYGIVACVLLVILVLQLVFHLL